MEPTQAPQQGASNSDLLFECRIEMPYGHYSKKNSKSIGWRGCNFGKRPFIRSTDKAVFLERYILSILSGIPAHLRPKEPLSCALHGMFTVYSPSFVRKDGGINRRGGDLENLIQGHCDALTKCLIILDDSLFTQISASKKVGSSAIEIRIFEDETFPTNERYHQSKIR